ncbi:MAG: plasmid stabilization protein [Alteromonadaceae bacterium]|nr:plasmid stabilization protein [Alteromonadaceae bacterium]MBH84313.1 plasmid stabilization protein [Alteromonadaceae bacterium]|tara:strand:+ start:981 stop:1280 length:300 start_codon:yes stop_codon:yes gene_type:complete
MATKGLVVSPAARDDLAKIYQYGLMEWGEFRSGQYLEKIKSQFWLLVDQINIGVACPDVLPDARKIVVGRHVIFYRQRDDVVQVIRVLHSRQDVHRNLG